MADPGSENCTKHLQYPQLPGPGCVVDTNTDEVIVSVIIIVIVLFTFYRILHVWAYTLNFSEASIQGPQGWDLVMNWIMERVNRTRRTRWRRRRKSHQKCLSDSGVLTEDDISRRLGQPPLVVLETPSGSTTPLPHGPGRSSVSRASSLRSSQTTLRDPWLMSLHYVRNARSMRDIYHYKQTLSASSASGNFLQTPGPGQPSASCLVRSHSCRSPPSSLRHTARPATFSFQTTEFT